MPLHPPDDRRDEGVFEQAEAMGRLGDAFLAFDPRRNARARVGRSGGKPVA